MPVSESTSSSSDHVHSEAFLASLMSRQLKLSVTCALAFVGMLLGLPLANYFAPDWMAKELPGGFTVAWFLLGIGFFPAVWLISWFFIRRSIALEVEEVAEVGNRGPTGGDSKRAKGLGR